MSPAAFATQPRRQIRHLIVSSLIGSSLLALVACTSSAPPAATPKPGPTQSAARPIPPSSGQASPAAKPSPQASPSPGASAENPIQILDATLADATLWVSLRLNEGEPLIVSGWKLEVGTQAIEIPGNAIIQPGETLTLRAGAGESSDREIFLGPDSYTLALAATPGTRVRLIKTTGEVAAETTVPRF